MNEQPQAAAARDNSNWRRLGLLVLACLALFVWGFASTRATPGVLRGPAQLPAKPQPVERAKPSGDPEPVCHGDAAAAATRWVRA